MTATMALFLGLTVETFAQQETRAKSQQSSTATSRSKTSGSGGTTQRANTSSKMTKSDMQHTQGTGMKSGKMKSGNRSKTTRQTSKVKSKTAI